MTMDIYGFFGWIKIFTLSVICLYLLECNAEDVDEVNFLTKYGYLAETSNQFSASHSDTSEALKAFQRFHKLKVTGELDSSTKQKMTAPRCGLPDIQSAGDYSLYIRKWKDNLTITYRILNTPRSLSKKDVKREIKKAFDAWSDVANLRFQEVNDGKATILISFENKHHDCNGSPFGRTELAHASMPSSLQSYIHFSNEHHWTTDYSGQNLLATAVHEIGHSLGLLHSNVQPAIMYSYAKNHEVNPLLHQDDKDGIQDLYGQKRGSSPANKGSSQGSPQVCQPLWYNQCKSNSECCSKNCFKEAHWAVGVCKP